jgi:hypothetical protein
MLFLHKVEKYALTDRDFSIYMCIAYWFVIFSVGCNRLLRRGGASATHGRDE